MAAKPSQDDVPVEGQPVELLVERFRQAVPVVLGEARASAAESSVNTAERFLNRLQRSHEAWAVMPRVLDTASAAAASGDDSLAVIEACRVLSLKARYYMGGLSQESHGSLRSMLVSHLLQMAGVPDLLPAFKHLSVALAATAVTMEGWTGIVASLVAAMGGPQTLAQASGLPQVYTLLRVLNELPWEAFHERISVSQARRKLVQDELGAAAEGVHSTLVAIMTSHASQEDVGKLVLSVFSSWLAKGLMPESVFPRSSLTAALVAGLGKESTMEECASILLDTVLNIQDNASLEDRLACAANLLPQLWRLEGTFDHLISYAEADETDTRAQQMAGIISCLGGMVAADMVMDGKPHSSLRTDTMRLMAKAVSSSSRPVAIEGLEFWRSLMSACKRAAKAGKAVSAEVTTAARALIAPLIDTMALPEEDFASEPASIGKDREEAAAIALAFAKANGQDVAVSKDDAEERKERDDQSREIQHHAKHCLWSMCEAVSTPAVASILVAECGAAVTAATQSGVDPARARTQLRRAESALQCTAYAMDKAHPSVDIPSVTSAIAALTTLPDVAGLHETGLRLISWASPWIAGHPEAFAAAEVFVRGHISHAGPTARVACIALDALVAWAPSRVVSSGLVPALAGSILLLPPMEVKDVLASLAPVCSELQPPETAFAAVSAVIEPIARELSAFVADPATGVTTIYKRHALRQRMAGIEPRTDADAVRRAGSKGVASLMAYLAHFLGRLRSGDGPSLTADRIAPIIASLWPTVISVLELGKAEEGIVEEVCHFHIALMRAYPELYADKIAALAADLAKRYEETPFGIYSYTGSVIVTQAAFSSTGADRSAILSMVNSITNKGFLKLSTPPTVQPFDENPVLVDDLFMLLTEAVRSMPDEMLGWTLLDAAIRCAYTGLLSSRQVAQSGVLLFLQTLIRLGVPFHTVARASSDPRLMERITNAARRRPTVYKAIGKYAAAIVQRLIEGAAGAMDRKSIYTEKGSIGSAIMACRDLMTPQEFAPLFRSHLDAVVPDSVIHPDEKQTIVNDVMSKGVGPDRKYEHENVDRGLLMLHDRCFAAYQAGRFDIPQPE